MKRFTFFIGILFLWFVFSSSGGRSNQPWEGEEKLSVNIISHEIEHSVSENNRQKIMNSRQNGNTSTEVANNQQWKKYKETAQKIQRNSTKNTRPLTNCRFYTSSHSHRLCYFSKSQRD